MYHGGFTQDFLQNFLRKCELGVLWACQAGIISKNQAWAGDMVLWSQLVMEECGQSLLQKLDWQQAMDT